MATITGLLHPRAGVARTLLPMALGLSALAVLVQVVLTGDAGSRAVWGLAGG